MSEAFRTSWPSFAMDVPNEMTRKLVELARYQLSLISICRNCRATAAASRQCVRQFYPTQLRSNSNSLDKALLRSLAFSWQTNCCVRKPDREGSLAIAHWFTDLLVH